MQTSPSFYTSCVPQEIWEHIFSYLSHCQQHVASKVCVSWRKCLHSQSSYLAWLQALETRHFWRTHSFSIRHESLPLPPEGMKSCFRLFEEKRGKVISPPVSRKAFAESGLSQRLILEGGNIHPQSRPAEVAFALSPENSQKWEIWDMDAGKLLQTIEFPSFNGMACWHYDHPFWAIKDRLGSVYIGNSEKKAMACLQNLVGDAEEVVDVTTLMSLRRDNACMLSYKTVKKTGIEVVRYLSRIEWGQQVDVKVVYHLPAHESGFMDCLKGQNSTRYLYFYEQPSVHTLIFDESFTFLRKLKFPKYEGETMSFMVNYALLSPDLYCLNIYAKDYSRNNRLTLEKWSWEVAFKEGIDPKQRVQPQFLYDMLHEKTSVADLRKISVMKTTSDGCVLSWIGRDLYIYNAANAHLMKKIALQAHLPAKGFTAKQIVFQPRMILLYYEWEDKRCALFIEDIKNQDEL